MLLTAQEAAAIAEEAVEQYLTPVGEMIAARAATGARTYTHKVKTEETDLAEGAIKKLTEAGFVVEDVTQEDSFDQYISIRW